jgi:putative Ca2+/H+ antiporter (TMEM165/GDT1 family)
LEAFLVSAGIVALAEMGDKTQLLALVLTARYGRPLPIVLGIFLATLVNHALAAAFGATVAALIGASFMRWIVAGSFLAMAAWTLVPDRADESAVKEPKAGVLLATLSVFFLAEIGDKTQIATVALAARYMATPAVVAGTTLGMMIANVPMVLAGERLLRKLPMRAAHRLAAALFALFGVLALL